MVFYKYICENVNIEAEEIIKKIYNNYGLELERKSVSVNIDSLMDFRIKE